MVAAGDRLSRIEIRAPVSGRVHQLNVFPIGGVIGSGEVAMLIVPEDDRLVVEARIEPSRSSSCGSASGGRPFPRLLRPRYEDAAARSR